MFTFSSPLLATKPHTTILSAPHDVYRTVTGLFSYLFCSTVPPVCTHRTAETTEKTIQQLWVAAAVETKRVGPKVKLFSTLRCTIEAITVPMTAKNTVHMGVTRLPRQQEPAPGPLAT